MITIKFLIRKSKSKILFPFSSFKQAQDELINRYKNDLNESSSDFKTEFGLKEELEKLRKNVEWNEKKDTNMFTLIYTIIFGFGLGSLMMLVFDRNFDKRCKKFLYSHFFTFNTISRNQKTINKIKM